MSHHITTRRMLFLFLFVLFVSIAQAKSKSKCTKMYGKDIRVCKETSTDCTFFAVLDGVSCSDYCREEGGGICLSAAANLNPVKTCKIGKANSCNTSGLRDNICRCSLGEEEIQKVSPQKEQETCREKYGKRKSILVCDETDTQCTFYVRMDGESCSDYCERTGGVCLSSAMNSGESCRIGDSNPCDSIFTDNICTCSLGKNPPPPPSPGPTPCTETYGKDIIMMCGESSSRCWMNVRLNGKSCDQFCEEKGGLCLEAWHNDGDTCVSTGQNACRDRLTDNQCRCSLPASAMARPTKRPTPPPSAAPRQQKPKEPPTKTQVAQEETCIEKYGNRRKPIRVCKETATECTFYIRMHRYRISCSEFCRRNGGVCLSAAKNGDFGDTCQIGESNTCDSIFTDNICTCSLGKNPPLPPTPGPTPCTETYGKDMIMMCGESSTQCFMNVRLNGKSCDRFCEQKGGRCLEAWHNDGDTCVSTDRTSCGNKLNDNLCRCSLPASATRPPTLPPTPYPTDSPTRRPTEKPTENPSVPPTKAPTASPTARKTKKPTTSPSAQPTKAPTAFPTARKTEKPTPSPTAQPTKAPTAFPTTRKTNPPTTLPSAQPTKASAASPMPLRRTEPPTTPPTTPPSASPTEGPIPAPTGSPTSLVIKTRRPTAVPTSTPSASPTPSPTDVQTRMPTNMPTPVPTGLPTSSPTNLPTKQPTEGPTKSLTMAPSSFEEEVRICFKCNRNGCFDSDSPGNLWKCKKWDCKSRASYCPDYLSHVDALAKVKTTYRPVTTIPTAAPTTFPPTTVSPTTFPPTAFKGDLGAIKKQGTGQMCSTNSDCVSSVCRNGACMASSECIPIKHRHGTPFDTNTINLVFVGSAFDRTTHEVWRSQVNKTYNVMKRYNMFDEKNEKLNVFRVDPEDLNPSFCFYNCAGIDRLLCCSITEAQRLAKKCSPTGSNLQTIVIHNEKKYGGAGYSYNNIATLSTHSEAPYIAIHELGHSLFELTDEYSYGPGSKNDANCAATRDCSKWADLIENTPVGYNQVSCVRGCKNNRYYIGEKSYMAKLRNNVGAVNERYTCCTYLALTKAFPTYCEAFDFEPGYLMNFCKEKDYQDYGAFNYEHIPQKISSEPFNDSSKYIYVSDPVSVEISLNYKGKGRVKVLDIPAPGPPGLYRKEQVFGDFESVSDAAKAGLDSVVRVKVKYLKGSQRLLISKKRRVEVPAVTIDTEIDDELSSVSEDAEVLNIIIDAKGRTIDTIHAKDLDVR